MSTEALLLALTTVVRPTTVAAVFAILATRTPQRLLVAYVVTGAAFSVLVGVVVVLLLNGLAAATSSSAPRPVLDLVLGGAALGYAGAAWAGWAPHRRSAPPPDEPTWMQRRLQGLTVRGSAVAGVLTHLPGLVYLAALNAIVGSSDGVPGALLQIGVYNAIWFLLPTVALLLSLRRAELSRELVVRLGGLVHTHRRLLTVLVLGVLGGYLLVDAVLELARHG
ncbi:GAP family protein [Pseudonocardia xishanensis]|uniref:Sap-like sulfolipid-1-addressing protein n=1 Tax=Pseudonocardia xishanensis TaxID=630995 RepID=A0ABP8RHT1_9PSEU